MSPSLYGAYVGAVLVLALSPGPSALLGSAHGLRYGARGTLPTIAGDLSANTLQMLAAALGVGAAIASSREVFTAIKWAGVAYLAWMGVQHWRSARSSATAPGRDVLRSPRARYLQGFLTSASNPKAVVFFAALFPQFINPSGNLALQLVALGLTFLVIDGSSVLLYAATAGRLSGLLAGSGRLTAQRRITGSVLIVAAGLLALKHAPATD